MFISMALAVPDRYFEAVTEPISGFEQQDAKPMIDDVICHYLDGNTLKDALSFIDYVRASKMKIKWTAANVWSVRYKGKHVLDIIVSADSWKVRLVYNHVTTNHVFNRNDAENIRNLLNTLGSSSEVLQPVPAMS